MPATSPAAPWTFNCMAAADDKAEWTAEASSCWQLLKELGGEAVAGCFTVRHA
jgi:hypothetical protein